MQKLRYDRRFCESNQPEKRKETKGMICMAENDDRQRPSQGQNQVHFNFAQLDPDIAGDVKVKGDGSDGGGFHVGGLLGEGIDLDDDSVASWMWPVMLILIWMLIYEIESVFFDTDMLGLAKLPVAMGAASQVSLMKGLTAWTAQMMVTHKFIGAILFILNRIFVLVVIVVASICTGFFHMSFGKILGNAILLLLCCFAGFLMHYPLGEMVRQWLILSTFAVGTVWFVTTVISIFFQGAKNHNLWFYVISHSTYPIVGASIGLYGLVMFTAVLCFKNSSQNKWLLVFGIGLLLLGLLLAFGCISHVHNLPGGSSSNIGAGIKLGIFMHLMAILLGTIRGVRDRTMYNYGY